MIQNACLVSQSTKIALDMLRDAAAAYNTHMIRDFRPLWGRSTNVTTAPSLKAVPRGYWPVVFMDKMDQPGALGYHTAQHNQPISFCLATPEWDITGCHECLTGDTMIPLLNGATVPIESLVGKDEFWVYSCKQDGSLRPGRGHSARVMRENAPIIEVMLDNGKSIRCTSDHLFMIRDGSYVEAGKLQPGQSLMPLYRETKVLDSAKPRKGMYPYEHVMDNRTEKWTPTHRMVAPFCSSGYVRHHKDFNRFNNSPDNIQVMKWGDHKKLHADHIQHYGKLMRGNKKNLTDDQRRALSERGKKNRDQLLAYNGSEKHKEDMKKFWGNPENKERVSGKLKAWRAVPENAASIPHPEMTPEHKEKSRQHMIAYNKSDEHRKLAEDLGRECFNRLFSDPEWKAKKLAQNSAVCKLRNHKKYHEDKGIFNSECEVCRGELTCVPPMNHKVVSVTPCGNEAVYDFTVDKYHNFATEAGVFVHNCDEMTVDPFGNRLSLVRSMPYGTDQVQFLIETDDPIEAQSYAINGIRCSNFLTPSYYDENVTNGLKYDFLETLKAPRTLIEGGYVSYVFEDGSWGQTTFFSGDAPSSRTLEARPAKHQPLRNFIDQQTQAYKEMLGVI